MTKKFINLTPHPINLIRADGTEMVIPPRSAAEGGAARVSQTPGGRIGDADGVPIYGSPAFGPVEGLPSPHEEETMYIVSLLMLSRPECRGRGDVVAPGTGPTDGARRDDAGRIIAVTRLIAAPND